MVEPGDGPFDCNNGPPNCWIRGLVPSYTCLELSDLYGLLGLYLIYNQGGPLTLGFKLRSIHSIQYLEESLMQLGNGEFSCFFWCGHRKIYPRNLRGIFVPFQASDSLAMTSGHRNFNRAKSSPKLFCAKHGVYVVWWEWCGWGLVVAEGGGVSLLGKCMQEWNSWGQGKRTSTKNGNSMKIRTRKTHAKAAKVAKNKNLKRLAACLDYLSSPNNSTKCNNGKHREVF